MKKLYFILLVLITINAQGQNSKPQKYINQKTFGGFVSTGLPLYKLADQSAYHPIIGGATFYVPLFKAKNRFNIAVDLQPQVVLVPFERHTEYEMGFNVVFSFGLALNPTTILSFNVGSGPHYISSTLTRQAQGFIFSDNFNFSIREKLGIVETSIFSGWRHISNAGLENPNAGVNNVIIGVSVAKIL